MNGGSHYQFHSNKETTIGKFIFCFASEIKDLETNLKNQNMCKLSFPSTSQLHEMVCVGLCVLLLVFARQLLLIIRSSLKIRSIRQLLESALLSIETVRVMWIGYEFIPFFLWVISIFSTISFSNVKKLRELCLNSLCSHCLSIRWRHTFVLAVIY